MKNSMKMVSQDKMIFTAYPEFNPINKLKMIANELMKISSWVLSSLIY